MRFLFVCAFLALSMMLIAQKKPLDHSVYDSWQSIGERVLSSNGQWVAYTVMPQEGDGELVIISADGRYKKRVPRGYSAQISDDDRYIVFRIKPNFTQTREARIRKKKPEDFPKDSIGILELGKDSVIKRPGVRSYKMPLKAGGWMAFHKEKDPLPAGRSGVATQRTVDSLKRKLDSLQQLVLQLKSNKSLADAMDADEPSPGAAAANEGSDLVLVQLGSRKERVFRNVYDYHFNEFGQKLLLRVSRSPRDSNSVNAVLLYDLAKGRLDTILKGGNDFRAFTMTPKGDKIAFLAERDTGVVQKTYGLYLYRKGDDSALLVADKRTAGMLVGLTVSEHGNLSFSKSGNRLFFGTAPLQPLKDTSLIDIDLVKLDVWHYNDDYLQPQQLVRLAADMRRSYLAFYDFTSGKITQLGSPALPVVMPSMEGDGDVFLAITDTGSRRKEVQWTGRTRPDLYTINAATGAVQLVKKDHEGTYYQSYTGKYILIYDYRLKQYAVWNGTAMKTVTSGIKVPLYNEESDVPTDPGPYGIMGWHEGDSAVYIYDRYDVWKVDPEAKKAPVVITGLGRKQQQVFRYTATDPEKKFFTAADTLAFRVQHQQSKSMAYQLLQLEEQPKPAKLMPVFVNNLQKSKRAPVYLFSQETFQRPPDIYLTQNPGGWPNLLEESRQLSTLNPQQQDYNWGSAELYRWKAFNGKLASGVLYKPEDFNPSKKYPMLIYFYEKLSDNLHRYVSPAPSASTINIAFFVSRGYLVFTPDIYYTKGHPGKDAFTYIVSGAQSLAKQPWVDAKNIGIQGQSWGGYQVAHLITATNMFKAAWAGAPVVNMFSAYGGIRWGSGMNRQFQYEKQQSRIGATPWQRRDLYIENSPFFHLDKVQTPVVIMSNDADDAVPWYQGIEFFTALRRLGKPVWLLNYNNEVHNLMERRNRKDISTRLQQFFDWQLKGEQPPVWITQGVPALKKGRDWGLEIDY